MSLRNVEDNTATSQAFTGSQTESLDSVRNLTDDIGRVRYAENFSKGVFGHSFLISHLE